MSNEFDIVYNGKPDVEVDLTQSGNPFVLTRNDGGGSEEDFREGTVTIRTKNGYLVIAAMDLEDHECFDVTYRRGPAEEVELNNKDYSVRYDAGERPIGVAGFSFGERAELTELGEFAKAAKDERVLGTYQGVRTVTLVIDKEEP